MQFLFTYIRIILKCHLEAFEAFYVLMCCQFVKRNGVYAVQCQQCATLMLPYRKLQSM